MNARTSIARTSPGCLSRHRLAAAIVLACLIGPALADETPEADKGRYTISTTPDGVVRLDTRTGAISTCSNTPGTGWSCYAVPDERAAMDAEIGRLQAENERLKAQLASRDQTVTGKIDEALPKDDALPKSDQLPKTGVPKADVPKADEPKAADGSRRIEIPLPSEQDMDRIMGVLEQAWRRLLDMANRVQKDMSGKI